MAEDLISGIIEFLALVLADNNFVYLEVWSIVHLISGFVLMYLIMRYARKKSLYWKFGLLFFLLLIWEGFEFVLYNKGIIRTEGWLDVLWDMIAGMFGGLLLYLINKASSGK